MSSPLTADQILHGLGPATTVGHGLHTRSRLRLEEQAGDVGRAAGPSRPDRCLVRVGLHPGGEARDTLLDGDARRVAEP